MHSSPGSWKIEERIKIPPQFFPILPLKNVRFTHIFIAYSFHKDLIAIFLLSLLSSSLCLWERANTIITPDYILKEQIRWFFVMATGRHVRIQIGLTFVRNVLCYQVLMQHTTFVVINIELKTLKLICYVLLLLFQTKQQILCVLVWSIYFSLFLILSIVCSPLLSL